MTQHDDFARYSCQIPLDGFGISSQKKLKMAKVLIVGVGGLGCPAALYLTAAGIGTLGLADDDKVDVKNLHRQILYKKSDIGEPKTTVAKELLFQQNPEVKIVCHPRIGLENAMRIIEDYDIVVDCSDNFDTRYLLNDVCVLSGKPLVYGAIYQYEGQVGVWNIKHGDTFSSNYRDIFSSVDDTYIPNCADGGVIPTVGGIIGCVQASEVIKYVTGIGEMLKNKLLIFDTLSMQSYTVGLPICSSVKIETLGSDTTEVKTINTEDFINIQNDKNYQIIDVRSREEHESFNLGGANIPLDEYMNKKVKLDLSKSTVFYCRTDTRSSQAAKKAIQDNPNAKILVLSGGVEGFRK